MQELQIWSRFKQCILWKKHTQVRKVICCFNMWISIQVTGTGDGIWKRISLQYYYITKKLNRILNLRIKNFIALGCWYQIYLRNCFKQYERKQEIIKGWEGSEYIIPVVYQLQKNWIREGNSAHVLYKSGRHCNGWGKRVNVFFGVII